MQRVLAVPMSVVVLLLVRTPGERLGRQVADFVVAGFLTRRHGQDDVDDQ